MRVRLLLPLYERKALAFLFLMGNCESLGGFFLHRAIVLPIKPDFTLRAYLMSEDTRKSAMKNQERLSVLAAPRRVRSTFFFARLRSAGGFYSSSRDCTPDEVEFHFARVTHV